EIKDRKFEEGIEMLRSKGLRMEKYTQWFHLEDLFSPMGVKAVGEFCQKIKDMSFVEEDKYLLGFQDFPSYIPDLGEFKFSVVKLSGRTPVLLERKILTGQAPGLEILIPAASQAVNGIADATHRIAAATLIDKGREEEFIKAFEKKAEEEWKKFS
ncbi:MAG: phosphoesterase, partial [Candidatus Hydrothermarchaeota archaeon]